MWCSTHLSSSILYVHLVGRATNTPTYSLVESIMKPCKNCGKQLEGRADRKIYCDERCAHDSQYKTYVERWLQGFESGVRGKTATSNHIKRYLIETRGNMCERCGWHEVNPSTGRVPITLEHIDGNWENNKIENLALLCPNCHSLTSTYCSLNNGRGRKARKNLRVSEDSADGLQTVSNTVPTRKS